MPYAYIRNALLRQPGWVADNMSGTVSRGRLCALKRLQCRARIIYLVCQVPLRVLTEVFGSTMVIVPGKYLWKVGCI